MEQFCYFVCSRGVLKSCTFRSLNPQSSCNNDIDYLNKMLSSKKMFNGMSIYICSELLSFFVLKILPQLKHAFVLVSGDSDLCTPKEALNKNLFLTLTNNAYLLKWFAQNTQIQNHPKIIQLPIGLDYHTISNNKNCGWKKDSEYHLPRHQEKILVDIRSTMKPFYERSSLIYINFSLHNDRFEQRKLALETIPSHLISINQDFIKRSDTWVNITNHAFVLSPFGNGMDCHRTWEALCLGAIPIIKAPNFKNLFENLPVLIVNEWTDITKELLDKTIEDFKNRQFNYDKLLLGYWKNMIKYL